MLHHIHSSRAEGGNSSKRSNPSSVTPPEGVLALTDRSWAEKNKSIIGSITSLMMALIAAVSGHLVDIAKLVLDHGWKAVLLVGSLGFVWGVGSLLTGLRKSLSPVTRLLSSLATHSGEEDEAHKQQTQALLDLSITLKRFSLTLDRLEARPHCPLVNDPVMEGEPTDPLQSQQTPRVTRPPSTPRK